VLGMNQEGVGNEMGRHWEWPGKPDMHSNAVSIVLTL
jgi:hypothetical protein